MQFGSSLDLQLGDRSLVRVLVTLPSYEGTWYVSIAVDDEFAGGIERRVLRSTAHHRILFLEPGPF